MELENDPDIDGKYLGTITKDFVKVAKVLQEASYQMRVRKISEYPIFPVSKQEIPIGQLILNKNESQLGLDWNYYISFLDEFIQRQLIVKEIKFKSAYQNPDEFCCLFVVDIPNNFSNFIFPPYPSEE